MFGNHENKFAILVFDLKFWIKVVGLSPSFGLLVTADSFMEKALGASLEPVPGLSHSKQCIRSSNVSNPGMSLSICAIPLGNVKHTSLGASPVNISSSL
jgi:hypothetical protein